MTLLRPIPFRLISKQISRQRTGSSRSKRVHRFAINANKTIRGDGAVKAGHKGGQKLESFDAPMANSDIILEIEVLRKLEIIMTQDRVIVLAGSFLKGLVARAGRIAALVDVGNFLGLSREAHDLKSTSGSFGARRLQYLGEQLEAACRDDDMAAVRLHTAAIADALPKTVEAILQYYPKAQSASESDDLE
jgi:HPt (histidine-containing phosphotransfer) domain-containing protein